jgi:hypothetical protein
MSKEVQRGERPVGRGCAAGLGKEGACPGAAPPPR